MNVIGEVTGKNIIIVDDLIDTAGTISNAATELKKRGALDIYVCATHPVFSKNAKEKLENPDIKEVIVCDTINIPEDKKMEKLHVVSLANYISELIGTIFDGRPMGVLVEGKNRCIQNE